MAMRIEDYALLGDGQSAALVDRLGSIDWLCWPTFDSDTSFAALVGNESNGHWRIAPKDPVLHSQRCYRGNSTVLDTTLETATGTVILTDWMAWGAAEPVLARRVRCERGKVKMLGELRARFDYGRAIPWCRAAGGRWQIVCGARTLWLDATQPCACADGDALSAFELGAGEQHDFLLTCRRSCDSAPAVPDAARLLTETMRFWNDWSAESTIKGAYAEPLQRSLITLKALASATTGGVIAAPTSSLPERLGGARNWDYRFCWLRDASFTLLALLGGGYHREAAAWRDWLVRAIAGDPAQLQILYAVDGSRRIDEWECPWLAGYEASAPVRFGNAAVTQRQLDVYGEVLNALYVSRRSGLPPDADAWSLEARLLDYLHTIWREPDNSIWEARSAARQFTFSKVMAWVAVDRALRSAREFHLDAPVARWTALATEIRNEVLQRGFHTQLNAFTQSYGSDQLDASCLLIPLMGFLPADDPRVCGTVRAIEERLMADGLVLRYRDDPDDDDAGGVVQTAFLACSFWLTHVRKMQGRDAEAHALFARLLALRNDVGLLAEKYDLVHKRQVGNFPQALSHVALVNAGLCLSGAPCTAH